jgi:hypothetical protein
MWWARSGAISANLTSSTPTATGNETFGNQPDPQFLSASITVPSSGFGVAFVGQLGASPSTAGDVDEHHATKAAISLRRDLWLKRLLLLAAMTHS